MDSVGKVGLIIPEIIDQLDYELLSGIFEQAKNIGFDVVVYTGIFNSQAELQQDYFTNCLENIYSLVCKSRLDGVIFAAERFHNVQLVNRIFEYLSQTDVLCLTLGYKYKNYPYIYAEQYSSTYMITKHLIETHHCKKLLCIAGVPEHEPSEERLQGFIDAMRDSDLPLCESDIIYGYYWKDVPKQVAADIAVGKLECPDAVVCLSDIMAITFIDELKKHGLRIPDDMAVTGYDGLWNSVIHNPQITTIGGRDRQFGIQAVCRLYEMITGKTCESVDAQQQIRYGLSCGCEFQKPEVHDSILYSLENHVASQLEKMFDRRTFIATDYINMLGNASDLDELFNKVDRVGHILRGWKWIDICLCKDWKISFDNPDQFRQQGYSDKMYLALSKRHGVNEKSGYEFPVGEIIPALVKAHEPSIIVLTSLHCHGQIFGYCATAYDSSDAVDIGDYYMRWCDAVSNGLYTLQKSLYIDYMHQQTELLSTTDPATGFLNKRGFIGELPDTLHRLRKDKKNYAIMLISWVKNDDDRTYDLAAVLANSLLSVSNAVMRVRLSEKCFALLLSAKLSEEIPNTAQAAMSSLENVLSKLFIGTSARPELLTELSEISVKKPAELEKLVNKLTDDFLQKCNAAESSYATTKQLMYKLRRDIMSQPQLEWSIAAISEQLNISITHLRRMYKTLFSVNIKDDVIYSRIERAKQLLLHTDLQIQEIAFRCGYQNSNHFMRQFKVHTGETAKEFRKKYSI